MNVYTEASIDVPRAPRPSNMRLRLFFHWLSVPPLTKQKVSPTAFRDRLGVTDAGGLPEDPPFQLLGRIDCQCVGSLAAHETLHAFRVT